MNLLNDDFSIKYIYFKCNDTNKRYYVSQSTLNKAPNGYLEPLAHSSDLYKREDGKQMWLTRLQAQRRFKNITEDE